MKEIVLRDYQDAAVHELRAGIRAGLRKQVLMSPTGSGKTEIACAMLQRSENKGARALFLVDRVNLIDQTSQRFDDYGIGHGVMQSGHWRRLKSEPIQLCSVQTLERRGIPPNVQVIFVDEAHCLRKKITKHLMETDAIVVGLTATPFAKGMGKIYDRVINVATMNDLIAQGHLVPLRMYAARSIDVTGMKVEKGEWSDREIEERGLEIVGDIVTEWKDKTTLHFGGPVKTIAFSATVDHGAELCRQFQDAGFNFQQISYLDGDDESRRELIREFRKPDSTIVGLVACEVLTKGFDVPDVMCGISARPYRKSLSNHMQQMGRVMRPSPGKMFGLWLCHSGNALRFRKDTTEIFQVGCSVLDDGERESKGRKEPTEKERAEIRCACGFVLFGFEKVCPGCGKERKRLSMVETKPGTMHEIGGKPAPRGLENRDDVWLQLCTAARLKHPGAIDRAKSRALAQFKSIYGEWPARGFDPHASVSMTTTLTNRLRHETIKWRKSATKLAPPPRADEKPVRIHNA